MQQSPECIPGPSFISSPMALGLLSQRRLDWNCQPQHCLCHSRDSFPARILYRNKQSSTGKKYDSPVEFTLFMGLVRNPETEGDSSWADTHQSGAKLLSYVSFYGTFSHATGEKERPISQSKGPAPPLEANSCLPHMCTPALSLFTLAKFRTVCFLRRGCLWRVCWNMMHTKTKKRIW